MNVSKLVFHRRGPSLFAKIPVLVFVFAVSCALYGQQPAPSQGTLSGSSEPPGSKAHFVGSETCKRCHLAAYNGWKKSRMANILLDPRQHPEAVVGDFAHPDPVRTFTLDDVAFTYGGRFKQRYFTKRGDDYFPLPAQWDVQKHRWLPYHVEAVAD